MIAPGCATRSARWLAASGVVGCGRLQPTSSRRGLFFERNRQSVRPLRAATAETEGVISCESLQLIASSRAQPSIACSRIVFRYRFIEAPGVRQQGLESHCNRGRAKDRNARTARGPARDPRVCQGRPAAHYRRVEDEGIFSTRQHAQLVGKGFEFVGLADEERLRRLAEAKPVAVEATTAARKTK
jgi:hypothetical protein